MYAMQSAAGNRAIAQSAQEVMEDSMAAQIELPGTQALVKRAPDPLEILQQAIEKNLSPETLKQLMDLQERWEATQARKSFVEAMNQFKQNPPEITKNRHVKIKENYQYDHATLDHVCDKIGPALSAHGISHRWETAQADGLITVTCILTHQDGHSERTTLQGLPDDSGGKNKIQAIGSTVTYLQRYTLLAACGLATEGQDDDAANVPQMDDLQIHLDELGRCETISGVESAFRAAYKKATELGATGAMLKLIKAKDARKKELQ